MIESVRIRTYLSVTFVVLSLAACGDKGNSLVHKADEIVRKAQACKDAKCASDALAELRALTSDARGLSKEDSEFLFSSAPNRIQARIDELSAAPAR